MANGQTLYWNGLNEITDYYWLMLIEQNPNNIVYNDWRLEIYKSIHHRISTIYRLFLLYFYSHWNRSPLLKRFEGNPLLMHIRQGSNGRFIFNREVGQLHYQMTGTIKSGVFLLWPLYSRLNWSIYTGVSQYSIVFRISTLTAMDIISSLIKTKWKKSSLMFNPFVSQMK